MGARMPARKRGATAHRVVRTARARESKPAKSLDSAVAFNRGLGVAFPTKIHRKNSNALLQFTHWPRTQKPRTV